MLVLFGGEDSGGDILRDTWTWDGAGWSPQDVLYFTVGTGPMFRVSAEGGDLVRVIDVEPGTAIRVGPEVVRSVWNDGPGDAQLVIFSQVGNDPAVQVEDFWPVD